MKQGPFQPLDTFAPRHIGPRGDDVAAMLKEVGASSLDALIGEAIPPRHPPQGPLNLPDAESESRVSRGSRRSRRRTRSFAASSASAIRTRCAERDSALRVRESGLVYAVHAVSSRDRARPSRIASQFPDDGVGPDRDGGGQRLAPGRGHRGGRGDGAVASRAGEEAR